MKDYYMLVERDDEGWYVGSIPELPGCHTQGSTIEELAERMREAIGLYCEDAAPNDHQSVFVGIHRVSVA